MVKCASGKFNLCLGFRLVEVKTVDFHTAHVGSSDAHFIGVGRVKTNKFKLTIGNSSCVIHYIVGSFVGELNCCTGNAFACFINHSATNVVGVIFQAKSRESVSLDHERNGRVVATKELINVVVLSAGHDSGLNIDVLSRIFHSENTLTTEDGSLLGLGLESTIPEVHVLGIGQVHSHTKVAFIEIGVGALIVALNEIFKLFTVKELEFTEFKTFALEHIFIGLESSQSCRVSSLSVVFAELCAGIAINVALYIELFAHLFRTIINGLQEHLRNFGILRQSEVFTLTIDLPLKVVGSNQAAHHPIGQRGRHSVTIKSCQNGLITCCDIKLLAKGVLSLRIKTIPFYIARKFVLIFVHISELLSTG